MTLPRLFTRAAFSLPFAAFAAMPATARAVDVGVRIEPGVAVPLSPNQTDRFTAGGETSFKAYLGLGSFVDLQAGFSLLALPASSETTNASAGTAWSDHIGLRLKRPHDASLDRGAFSAISPWLDGDALYVKTGGLDRPGVTIGAGLSLPLDAERHAWLGPYVRYMQIFEPSRAAFSTGDGRLLFIGLNFELGTSPIHRPVARVIPEASPPQVALCPYCAPVSGDKPDRDHDGIADAADNCPDVAGPIENSGCPLYKKVIVTADKLELKEKIMFAFDRAAIETESFPLLDEVVQALKDNKSFKVRVEGHTDSTGPAEHNQTLSEDRAAAVLAYLQSHGIAADRLVSKGFGSTMPASTNKTAEGREDNRRVEFVIQFKIIDRSAQ